MSASDMDVVWAALEPHIDLPDGFALVLVYADHPQPIDELWARARARVGGHSERLTPAGEDAPTQLDAWLRKSAPGQRRLAWIELYREDKLDDQIRGQLLGQLNRSRSFVERALACPLVLVLPPRLRREISTLAPDLWAVRSHAVTIEAAAGALPGVPMSVEATGSIDVLVITALKLELDALLAVEDGRIEPWVGIPGKDPVYRATFEGHHGSIEIAAARTTRMGGAAAVVLAERLVSRLLPRSLAMCGICAGRPGYTEVGDVIIADRVFQADVGKLSTTSWEADWTVHPMPDHWLRAAQELAGPATARFGYGDPDAEDAQWWLLEQLHAGRDPLASAGFHRYFPDERRAEALARLIDALGYVSIEGGRFELTEVGETALLEHHARHGWRSFSRLPYWVQVGPIASGNAVVADGDVWQQIVGLGMRKILGLDMEAAALGAVATAHGLPFVVTKGVMDHADRHKDARAEDFAARASAEVLCALLREVASEPTARAKSAESVSRSLEQDIAALERDLVTTGEPPEVVREHLLRFRRQLRGGPELSSGDVLAGRFRLLSFAGSGGFATVWKAVDRQLEATVAVKVLHGQWSGGARQARFEGGARRTRTLEHEAIVQMCAPPQRDGPHLFFVMRWCEGRDLRQALSKGTLDQRGGLRALARALDGLAYAHTQGVVHRDVEPGNILIDGEGRGYIGDFDLALVNYSTTAGTRTGAMGTFVYAAPEQLRDAKEVGIEADVYGAGMCALFVLAGQDPPVLVERMEPEFIAHLPCSAGLRRVLTRAVALDAKDRMHGVEELAAALRDELALDESDAGDDEAG